LGDEIQHIQYSSINNIPIIKICSDSSHVCHCKFIFFDGGLIFSSLCLSLSTGSSLDLYNEADGSPYAYVTSHNKLGAEMFHCTVFILQHISLFELRDIQAAASSPKGFSVQMLQIRRVWMSPLDNRVILPSSNLFHIVKVAFLCMSAFVTLFSLAKNLTVEWSSLANFNIENHVRIQN